MTNSTITRNSFTQTVLPDRLPYASNLIRILVVDDQNLIRQKIGISIEGESDLQVVGFANNGEMAIEQIEKLHPDIALIDIEMPGMNGLAATEIISQRFTNTKVLVLSGYDEKDYIENALKAGAKGYLLKTTPKAELVHAIRYIEKGYLQLGPGLFEKLETENSNLSQSKELSTSSVKSMEMRQSTQLAAAADARAWSSLTKELVNTMPQTWTRGLLYFLAVFMAIVLPWSMLAKVDETGTARGRLEPKGNTIKLDAPVPGTVTAIKIKEGQKVKKGQPLIELDSKKINAELKEAQAKLNGLSLQSSNFEQIQARLQMNIKQQLQQNQAATAEQVDLIEQTRQKIALHQKQIVSTAQLVNKDREIVDRYRKFQRKGVVSGNQLDDVERRSIQNSQTLTQANSDKIQQQTELKKQQSSYQKIIHQGELAIIGTEKQLKETQSQIISTQSEIMQTKDRIESLQHQLKQGQIVAPTDGTIFQLAVGHPGTVVQPSQTLIKIAPKGTPLVLKAQMPTQESGFLRVGMPVKLKFDAYPFQDYGVIEGRLTWVSPDSKAPSSDPGQQPKPQIEAFEVEVTLNSNYIQTKNKKISLAPGQTATAEAIVRQRHLIDFILDPFKKLQKGGLEL
jgi:hemolysin D